MLPEHGQGQSASSPLVSANRGQRRKIGTRRRPLAVILISEGTAAQQVAAPDRMIR